MACTPTHVCVCVRCMHTPKYPIPFPLVRCYVKFILTHTHLSLHYILTHTSLSHTSTVCAGQGALHGLGERARGGGGGLHDTGKEDRQRAAGRGGTCLGTMLLFCLSMGECDWVWGGGGGRQARGRGIADGITAFAALGIGHDILPSLSTILIHHTDCHTSPFTGGLPLRRH